MMNRCNKCILAGRFKPGFPSRFLLYALRFLPKPVGRMSVVGAGTLYSRLFGDAPGVRA